VLFVLAAALLLVRDRRFNADHPKMKA